MAIDAASEHGEQQVEDHSLSQGIQGVVTSRRPVYTHLEDGLKSRRLIISTCERRVS
jgi:hypothetical protein